MNQKIRKLPFVLNVPFVVPCLDYVPVLSLSFFQYLVPPTIA
jgi:hypothetical protein